MIKAYVTLGCPYCRALMDWLRQYNVEHELVVFQTSTEKIAFYDANPGARSVPQIFIDGVRIGGWSDLNQHPFKKQVEDNAKI